MIAQFALRLICGMSLMWALMPRRQVTSGFFRIQMLVVMGLGVLTALAITMPARNLVGHAMGLLPGLIVFLGFFSSVLWTLECRAGAEGTGYAVLCVSSALIVVPNFTPDYDTRVVDAAIQITAQAVPSVWHCVSKVISEFIGAAVLGGTVVGMLLGHWYLTAPTMSIEPLKRINLYLGVAGILRLLVSATTLALLWSGAFDTADALSRLNAVPTAWVGLRWLAGIIGPIVVSLMVWRILKYRNTQAATGVLFVGVILAFIGDMTAALLLRETGLPL